ncbi:MAG: MBL fold metallo-hydrolase [Chloroflexi bacterium]|jgi:hydroxyacylglutathione hydrolase|nr:MBL fold metallo-hydrolase [Chloroflexota bacterium]MBT7081800.1 MBL fold metallo-hydrolase [Chloroflexota bacterium]MBT7290531.1 MBL fold metallo-hydrolase [Chloroflexota bacterium]
MIIETLVLGPFMANCYIVGSDRTKDAMVIDACADAQKVIDTAKKQDLSINTLITTHNHVDHIGAISEIRDITGGQFVSHGAWRDPGLTERFARIMGPQFRMPPDPDRVVEDGDIIEVGDLKFKVIHTPGHSPDGISIYGHGVVFSGDTLFNLGIGRSDFTDSVHEDLMASLTEKLMTLPDETIVLSGHGPQTTIGYERKYNPFLRAY